MPARLTTRQAIFIGTAMASVGSFATALYTPAMPTLVQVFGTDIATIKLSITLYLLGFGLSQLVVGSLSDAIGRRPVSIGFFGLYLVASLVAMVAPNAGVLLAARLFQGVGAAVCQTIARAVVRDCFEGPTAVRVINAINAALVIGPLVAPTLGGMIIEFFGWHATFVAMVLHGVLVVALVISMLPETAPATGLERLKLRSIAGDYYAVARDPGFARLALINGFVMGTIYASPSMLPFVLIDRIGLNPIQFGMSMLLQSGSYLVGTQVFRLLLPRLSMKVLLRIGIAGALLGSGLLALSMIFLSPTVLRVMAPAGLIAFSISWLVPITIAEALQPFPEKAGAASALIGFIQIACGFLGTIGAALLHDPIVAITVVYPGMVLIGSLGFWLIGRTAPARRAAPAE